MDNPLLIFLLLLGLSATFRFIQKRKPATILSGVALAWLVTCGSTPLPQVLVTSLEGQYPVAGHLPDSSYILVLGAGFTADPKLPPTNQLSDEALGRLVEGVRLIRRNHGNKLVLSGYSSLGETTQAEIMARAAVELGVAPTDTMLLIKPTKTREELEFFRSRFPNRQVVVVTSAVHMPRTMAWCNYFKLKAWPAPTGHLIKHNPAQSDFDFVPSHRKLMMMQRALHEYIGLLLVPDNDN